MRPRSASAPPASSQAPSSALGSALEQIGDRWSLLVVEALLDGPRRFGELTQAIPGLAANILSDRLRKLERDGLVRSAPYSQRPPRLDYSLTVDGRGLASALRLLADWGARHQPGNPDHEPLSHAPCGTPLEVHWYCPTCTVFVRDEETTTERVV